MFLILLRVMRSKKKELRKDVYIGSEIVSRPFLGKRVKFKHLMEIKSRILDADEQVKCIISGSIETIMLGHFSVIKGFLAVTNRRAIFYAPKLLGRYEVEIYPINQITSVEWSKGLMMDRIELTVAGDWKVIKWIPKGDGEKATTILKQVMDEARASPLTIPPSDIFAQIERLGRLRDRGLITQEEFERKKKELLARL